MSCFAALVLCLFFMMVMEVPLVDGFIVFLGNTTACDICDEYQTYSGR